MSWLSEENSTAYRLVAVSRGGFPFTVVAAIVLDEHSSPYLVLSEEVPAEVVGSILSSPLVAQGSSKHLVFEVGGRLVRGLGHAVSDPELVDIVAEHLRALMRAYLEEDVRVISLSHPREVVAPATEELVVEGQVGGELRGGDDTPLDSGGSGSGIRGGSGPGPQGESG